MTAEEVCRLLDWDSAFFGRRIARVIDSQLDSEKMDQVLQFARAESVECIYCLVDDGDLKSIRCVEKVGFRCMDVRITRELPMANRPGEEAGQVSDAVGFYREADWKALRAIARSSHGATRFYHDPEFHQEKCDALYERWLANACANARVDENEKVLVVREGGRAVGYATCECESTGIGLIGLIAIAEAARGRGLGELLVRSVLAWFHKQQMESVRVISQVRNVESARLYERLGFVTTATERWYHLWPELGQHAEQRVGKRE